MNYLAWNNAIAAHFFNAQSAHRPVYLYVTQDLIDGLGTHDGTGISEFVSCVSAGPPWITDNRLSICGKAYRTFRDWRSDPKVGEREFPPYLAYLALFALAAGSEGDFAAHAYYPRLRNLLGENEKAGMPNGFDKMWELWVDLEEWSKSDRSGELGEFEFRISGAWQHVGLPVAQTLLSESDRRGLPELFSTCALDPTSPPAEAELLGLLKSHAGSILQRRTRRLLSSADTAVRFALVYAVASELEHWNGCSNDNSEDGPPSFTAVLRLCCQFDEIATTLRTELRCKANAEFPESGLSLTRAGGAVSLVAEEHGFGWSSELRHQEDNSAFDASSLDWTSPFELHDDAHRWRVVMRPAAVRVFRAGVSVGLPGYVEASRIARGTEFIIAASEHLDEIREWGASECEGFCELEVSSGLPANWLLFRATAVKGDTLIREISARLSLPSAIRIRLHGGISAQDGTSSRFFSFARPIVVIDCPNDEVTVACNGEVLSSLGEAGTAYELPSKLPLNQTIRIEASTPSGDRAQRSLQLVDAVFPSWNVHDASFGPLGQRLDSGANGAMGSSLNFPEAPDFDYGAALVPISAERAFLIGRVPGQVSEWPRDSLPEWPPMWVVVKEKRRFEWCLAWSIWRLRSPFDIGPRTWHPFGFGRE